MKTKSILQSRTFWVNVIAFLLLFLPAVQAWIQENPKSGFSILVALNLVLRTLTSSGINIFASGGTMKDGTGSMVPGLFGIAVAGCLCMGGLPSCSPEATALLKEYPIQGCYIKDGVKVCASTKSGMSFEVDQSSGK